MTREAFADAYAFSSGLTVEQLKAQGREPRPCICGHESCPGWLMAYVHGVDWPEDSPFPTDDLRYTLTRGSA